MLLTCSLLTLQTLGVELGVVRQTGAATLVTPRVLRRALVIPRARRVQLRAGAQEHLDKVTSFRGSLQLLSDV